MAWPFQSWPTLDELKQKLAAHGVHWVQLPDPTGQFDTGYFERIVGGQTIGCPVSIKIGACVRPSLIQHIYQRLLLADDAFQLH